MYRPQSKNRLFKRSAELQRLHQEYAQLKWSSRLVDASIARSMREIKLSRLYDSIRKIIANKVQQPRTKQPKTLEQLRLERLKYAREKGNEYSQGAMRQIVEEVYERRNYPNYIPDLGMKAVTYGNYYSERNRLLQKDAAAEYDQVYQILLLRCAMFEKEHPDVRGFLDQKILCGTGYSLAMEATSSQKFIKTEEDSSQPEEAIEPAHKEIGVQVPDRNFSRDVLIWSQAENFIRKTSDTDSDFEESDQDENFSCVVEKIGDH